MKGIVFTEFLEMVENEFGYEVVDYIIDNSDLESGGVYTSIGTYHHSEVVQLLMNLSEKVEMDPGALLKTFGKYLFDTFTRAYPMFFEAEDNAFGFLDSIDRHIHVEVLKLYPDATLPRFETQVSDDDVMTMIYKSERKMGALAEGLIEKAMEYYNTPYILSKELMNEDGSMVKFVIEKK